MNKRASQSLITIISTNTYLRSLILGQAYFQATYILAHLTLTTILWYKYYYYSYLQRRNLKYREVRHLAQVTHKINGRAMLLTDSRDIITNLHFSSLLCSKHWNVDCIPQACLIAGASWMQPIGSYDRRWDSTKRRRALCPSSCLLPALAQCLWQ